MRTAEEIIARLHYVQSLTRLHMSHYRLANAVAARRDADEAARDLQRQFQLAGLADHYQSVCVEHRKMWPSTTFHNATRPILAVYYDICKAALQIFLAPTASVD
jgi:hypothetical protein